MHPLIPISIGGVLGASLRYYVSLIIQKNCFSFFPYGTLIVNISGCFFIGFIMQTALIKASFPINLKLFFVTGFAGSYTTFSTFEYETYELMLNYNIEFCIINIISSNLLCFISVYIGTIFSKKLFC
jgi:CrcB protein